MALSPSKNFAPPFLPWYHDGAATAADVVTATMTVFVDDDNDDNDDGKERMNFVDDVDDYIGAS